MGAAVRWGFLGAGGITRAVAPAVHAARGARLQAVAARDADRARRLGPVGPAYDDYARLVEDPSVDAVYIALANDAHKPWTLAALAAGKHVLCEKPLALDAAEARAMSDAAKAADRLLVEASWYRWHPRTIRAQALLAAGAVGRVRRAWTGLTFGGPPAGNYRMDPAMGGGALYDVGCYAVSAALWAAGWAPLAGLEATLERGPTGVDLRGEATLRLGATVAQVRFGMADEEQQWLAAEGENGRIDMPEHPFTSYHQASTLLVSGRAEHFPPVDPYQLMIERVSAQVRGDDDAVVPLGQSLRVAETLDAIVEAAAPEPALEPPAG